MAAVSTFWIEQKDHDRVEFFVGETRVGSYNRDQNCERAITAEQLFIRIAKAVGAEVKRI